MSNFTNIGIDVTSSPESYGNKAIDITHGVMRLAVTPITLTGSTSLVYGTASTGETQLTGNLVFVDAGSASGYVNLPPEATSAGVVLYFANTTTGNYQVLVKDDSGNTTILTLAQNKNGAVFCNGSNWDSILTA